MSAVGYRLAFYRDRMAALAQALSGATRQADRDSLTAALEAARQAYAQARQEIAE